MERNKSIQGKLGLFKALRFPRTTSRSCHRQIFGMGFIVVRIYIDTNVFLDFYQASTDRIAVFSELVTRAQKVILPEQTIREFYRNRNARLSKLARNVEESATSSIFTTAVIRELPEFGEWVKSRDAAIKHAKAVASRLRRWIVDEASDPVISEFKKLVNMAVRLPNTEKAVIRARRRKLLGDPPTSPDRHTIGDELIWETLLEGCRDDLVIVSRDRTFIDNPRVLKDEFDSKGRRLILITEHLREALSQIGEPSTRIAEAEKQFEATPTLGDRCSHCGGQLMEHGFESDSGELSWLVCSKCGFELFPPD